MIRSRTLSATAATAAMACAWGNSLLAQDSIVRMGDPRVSVEMYGQVNRAILFGDNGEESETFFVDNDHSSSRLGFRIGYEGNVVDAGVNLEFSIQSNASGDVTFDEPSSDFEFGERKMEVFASGNFGKISLGQGDTASNGTAEIDLSGTDIIGYVGVADYAGGLTFNNSGVSVGDVFNQFDGLSRDDRIRYDTPEFGGFKLSTSVAEEQEWDVALRFARAFGTGEFEAAVAYAEPKEDEIDSQVSLSASAIFSGISVTAAYGTQSLVDGLAGDPEFYYVKLAYKEQLFNGGGLGKTGFGIDYYDGSDIGAADGILEADSQSWAIFAVQDFSNLGAQVYLGYRNYTFDSASDDDDLYAVMGGARIRF